MHTVYVLLCFVIVNYTQIIQSYFSGTGAMVAPVPRKQPWRIWANDSHASTKDDYVTTTTQSMNENRASIH